MNGQTTAARARHARIVELYRAGSEPPEIARRLRLSLKCVYRHLHIDDGVPLPYARQRILDYSKLARAPFRQLHGRDGASEVVLGRKFCAGCGRWRQLVDFRPITRRGGMPCARCRTCETHASLHYQRRPEYLADRREYMRFYKEAKRRAAGVVPSTARRTTVVDHVERATLPLEPLLTQLQRYDDGELTTLAVRAGVSPRALYRYRYGESAAVRIDVADKLAVAMGTTSSLIWGDSYYSTNGNGAAS